MADAFLDPTVQANLNKLLAALQGEEAKLSQILAAAQESVAALREVGVEEVALQQEQARTLASQLPPGQASIQDLIAAWRQLAQQVDTATAAVNRMVAAQEQAALAARQVAAAEAGIGVVTPPVAGVVRAQPPAPVEAAPVVSAAAPVSGVEQLAAAESAATAAAARRVELEQQELALTNAIAAATDRAALAGQELAAAQASQIGARRDLGVARQGGGAGQEQAALQARDAANENARIARQEVAAAQKNLELLQAQAAPLQAQLDDARSAEALARQQIAAAERQLEVQRLQAAAQERLVIPPTSGGRPYEQTIGGQLAAQQGALEAQVQRDVKAMLASSQYFEEKLAQITAANRLAGLQVPEGTRVSEYEQLPSRQQLAAPTESGSAQARSEAQAAAAAATGAQDAQAAATVKASQAAQGQLGVLKQVSVQNIGTARSVDELSAAQEKNLLLMAQNDNQLTRHGALTTEFLNALGRGEVTLSEFGNQIGATIGKFAGWTGAAAAVYGAYGAVVELSRGAIDASNTVGQLHRTIDGLDNIQATNALITLAHETNTSMKDAGSAVFAFSRTFHNVDDAAYAAGLALRAFQLDGVSVADQVKAQTAITQQFGLTARGLGPVYDELAAGQREFNARISDQIPLLQRSASAVKNAGGDLQKFIEITTVALRTTQLSGSQLGTFFARSASNFLNPTTTKGQADRAVLSSLGIDPNQNYTDLIFNAIKKSATLSGDQRRQLALAIGGPQLGARVSGLFGGEAAGLLDTVQQKLAPGQVKGSFLDEFAKEIGTTRQQLKAIVNDVQQLGAALSQSGISAPVGGFVKLLQEGLTLSTDILKIWDELPGPIKEAAALAATFTATRFVLQRAGLSQDAKLLGPLFGRSPEQEQSARLAAGLKYQQDYYQQQLQSAYIAQQPRLNTLAIAQQRLDAARATGDEELIAAETARFKAAAAQVTAGQVEIAALQKSAADAAQKIAADQALQKQGVVAQERAQALGANYTLTTLDRRKYVAEPVAPVPGSAAAAAEAQLAAQRVSAGGVILPPGVQALGASQQAAAAALTSQGAAIGASAAASGALDAAALKTAEAARAAAASSRAAAQAAATAGAELGRLANSLTPEQEALLNAATDEGTVSQRLAQLADALQVASEGAATESEALAACTAASQRFLTALAAQQLALTTQVAGSRAVAAAASTTAAEATAAAAALGAGAAESDAAALGAAGGVGEAAVGGSLLRRGLGSLGAGISRLTPIALGLGLAYSSVKSQVDSQNQAVAQLNQTIAQVPGSLDAARTQLQTAATQVAATRTSFLNVIPLVGPFLNHVANTIQELGGVTDQNFSSAAVAIQQLQQALAKHNPQGPFPTVPTAQGTFTGGARLSALDRSAAGAGSYGGQDISALATAYQYGFQQNQPAPGSPTNTWTFLFNQAKQDAAHVTDTIAGRQRWLAQEGELAAAAQRLASNEARGQTDPRVLQLIANVLGAYKNTVDQLNSTVFSQLPKISARPSGDPFAAFQGYSTANILKGMQATADRLKIYGFDPGEIRQLALAYRYLTGKYAAAGSTDAELQQVDQAKTLLVGAIQQNVQDLENEAAVAGNKREKLALLHQAAAELATAKKTIAEGPGLAQALQQVAKGAQIEQTAINVTANIELSVGKVMSDGILGQILGLHTYTAVKKAVAANVTAESAALAKEVAATKAADKQLQDAINKATATVAAQLDATLKQVNSATTTALKVPKVPKVPQVPASEDPFELTRLQREIDQARADGNPVAVARIAERLAREEIAAARNEHERLQGILDLVNAENQFNKAIEDRKQAYDTYLESATNDPIKKARIELKAATEAVKYAAAHGGTDTQDYFDARAKQNDARTKLIDARVSGKEQDIQFYLDMGKISVQTAIEEYRAILSMHNLTKAQRQRILEDIKRLKDGSASEFGALDLGTIRLPTPYEIRRGLLAAQQAGAQALTQQTYLNVNVSSTADIHAFGTVLDRYVNGGTGKSLARAAGTRGG